MNIEIANRLVNLRKSNNLSQEALAEKLGISRQAVSKWERAEASPDTDNLILLSRLYGVSLDELLKTEDEIPITTAEPSNEGMKDEEKTQKDNEGNLFEEVKKSDIEDDEEEEEISKLGEICERIPMLWIVILAYFITGCVFGAWYMNGILFLVIPIWNSLVVAIERKNANCFAYPVLVTLIYLCLGWFYDAWHPGWIIYLTIPVYYSMAGRI
ncbi:XRE family transcriptional regulator [Parablautia intestinalis]|uniref:XRE family transcriptional regulator n=1 Tax=Parablautia intestinalis TaxID=2320100 RepID=A0A3A9AGI1_9FIRM|nr:helix-turn-helix transcriptional regulator [Parablautia intestinalis]RKI90507.1 XRE family transcriptional regulator [Parablautia intestinalis]